MTLEEEPWISFAVLMLALLKEAKFLYSDRIDEDLLLGMDVGENLGDEAFA